MATVILDDVRMVDVIACDDDATDEMADTVREENTRQYLASCDDFDFNGCQLPIKHTRRIESVVGLNVINSSRATSGFI